MINKKVLEKINFDLFNSYLETYSCNIKKNIKCRKKNCSKNCCTRTTKYKYAKKTFWNYIKKIVNKLRGKYKYE